MKRRNRGTRPDVRRPGETFASFIQHGAVYTFKGKLLRMCAAAPILPPLCHSRQVRKICLEMPHPVIQLPYTNLITPQAVSFRSAASCSVPPPPNTRMPVAQQQMHQAGAGRVLPFSGSAKPCIAGRSRVPTRGRSRTVAVLAGGDTLSLLSPSKVLLRATASGWPWLAWIVLQPC